ncbi:helix-turn-helix domain-containing protein [Longispora sp. NPDC051575]|uniref:helix-turn-helix domain-containing protein n=1 Tax=Longispora sp. NPDC051575 TaxID=3154943 RepID=UPI003428A9AE
MRITDPKAIRALAHPLRLNLLELLAAVGPATAAHCGRVLDVSQASCSFHLRQLAKYGFVVDAGPGHDRRERQWQVPESRPMLRIGAGGDEVVRRELARVVVQQATQAILDGVDTAEGSEWRSIMSAMAVLTAEEAADVKEKWKTLLEPYIARTHQPGRRHVRYFMAATPLPEDPR